MSIVEEKAEVLKRFEKVYDPSLIRAIRSLLDFGLSKQKIGDEALAASIDQGLKESSRGETTPHDQAIEKIRSRYNS